MQDIFGIMVEFLPGRRRRRHLGIEALQVRKRKLKIAVFYLFVSVFQQFFFTSLYRFHGFISRHLPGIGSLTVFMVYVTSKMVWHHVIFLRSNLYSLTWIMCFYDFLLWEDIFCITSSRLFNCLYSISLGLISSFLEKICSLDITDLLWFLINWSLLSSTHFGWDHAQRSYLNLIWVWKSCSFVLFVLLQHNSCVFWNKSTLKEIS